MRQTQHTQEVAQLEAVVNDDTSREPVPGAVFDALNPLRPGGCHG